MINKMLPRRPIPFCAMLKHSCHATGLSWGTFMTTAFSKPLPRTSATSGECSARSAARNFVPSCCAFSAKPSSSLQYERRRKRVCDESVAKIGAEKHVALLHRTSLAATALQCNWQADCRRTSSRARPAQSSPSRRYWREPRSPGTCHR